MTRPYAHIKSQNQRRKEDYHLCQFCGSDQKVAAHHIFEYSKGGSSAPEGMITVCERCHLRIIHKDSRIRIIKKENGILTIGRGGK
ncbi:HNH endonuclease [Undibacterium sp.]|uniref:HNH endonuclease n=1 Tax=Undibacterium sp. TaxID=1914977 RepID=UPI003523098B